jgi:hypothetical protein
MGLVLSEGTPLDTAIHIITVLVALFMFALSSKTYLAVKRKRLLYVCLGFFAFSVKEALVLAEVLTGHDHVIVSVSHLLNLVALGLFFAGVASK